MHYVYILQSLKDNSLYTGFTSNLKKRISQHKNGLNPSTKYKRPLKLIYYEAYLNKGDAINREKFLKSGSGKKYLDKQLKLYFRDHPRQKRN